MGIGIAVGLLIGMLLGVFCGMCIENEYARKSVADAISTIENSENTSGEAIQKFNAFRSKSKKAVTVLLVITSSFCSSVLADTANGEAIYKSRCAKCHGDTGNGDGKVAKRLELSPPPTKFNNNDFLTNKKGVDISPLMRIAKVIKEGGPSVKQSPAMEAYTDLTDAEVQDIVDYLKTLVK